MLALHSIDHRIENSIRLLARLEVSLGRATTPECRKALAWFLKTEEDSLQSAIELRATIVAHLGALKCQI